METIKTAEEALLDYKKAAYKVTTYIMICYLLRFTVALVIRFVYIPFQDSMSETAGFIIKFFISALFLQILPSVIGYFFFGVKRRGGLQRLYKLPKLMKKAIANFPAMYGLGQATNLLTILVIFLITQKNDLAESMNTLNALQPPDILSAIFLLFDLAVIAPVFEEFMFRGLIMNELRPFGNGFAVLVSGIVFGLFHGNFNQLFYTAVIGIILGYIANVTESVLPTTVLHAMMNSLGGIILLLLSTDSVQRFVIHGSTEDIPNGDMIVVACYAIFMVCLMALILIGLIAGISKLCRIKRYKVKPVSPEISVGKRLTALILSVPAIISVILIIDTFAGFSASLIMKGVS